MLDFLLSVNRVGNLFKGGIYVQRVMKLYLNMAGSISRIYRDFFFFFDLNTISMRILIDCFVKKSGFIFFSSFILIAFALIAIYIASNRWRGFRAETRSADLLIETAIFPTVLQCTVKF